jgi:ribosome maturation protein Sdo1
MFADEQELIKTNIELRALGESVKSGSISSGEAQRRLDTLKAEKREIEQQIAQRCTLMDGNRANSLADVKNAMLEKRSITLQGTGAINQIRELQHELSQKKEILHLVKYFFGANSSTLILILSPGLASPVQAAEGATGSDVDTIAALGAK